jgi:hypothetical protein
MIRKPPNALSQHYDIKKFNFSSYPTLLSRGQQRTSSNVCQHQRQFDAQSAAAPCRLTLGTTTATTITITITTTTTTTTTVVQQRNNSSRTTARRLDDVENVAQGRYEIRQGPQQYCWSQCHFQAFHSTATTFGKAPKTTRSGCC